MAILVRALSEVPKPAAGQKILPREDYSELLEADALQAAAEDYAARRRTEADAEYDAQKARGFADGQEQANAEAAAQVMTIVGGSVDYLARAEEEVGRAVMICLRKILGRFEEVELVQRIVAETIDRMRGETRVTLRVRPTIEDETRRRLAVLLAQSADIGFVEVVGDDALPEGGCRLESDAGVIDCGLETQLAAIETLFKERTGAPG